MKQNNLAKLLGIALVVAIIATGVFYGLFVNKLRGSGFLPGRHPVEQRVKDYVIDELDLHREGAVLETNRPYLIPLKERLALPPDVAGKANPKSSTGRLDVFTRVITDGSDRFDEVAAGYSAGK